MKQVYIVEGRHADGQWFPIVAFIDKVVAQDYVNLGYEEDDCWGDDGLRIHPIPFRDDYEPEAASN